MMCGLNDPEFGVWIFLTEQFQRLVLLMMSMTQANILYFSAASVLFILFLVRSRLTSAPFIPFSCFDRKGMPSDWLFWFLYRGLGSRSHF